MSAYDYDLFTIGAGSGGVRASRMASAYGARVGIAEEYRVGGTCVIRGCVPKKLFVYASEFSHAFEDAAGYGWRVGETSFDWAKLIENKDKEIDRLNGLYLKTLDNAGVEVIQSRAELKDAHTVHLIAEDREVTAERILIATGGAPWVDESIEGHELGITSNEAFHLESFPKQIVVAGGGYIAIEFACIFRGLGADVTLVYRGENILRYFDADISARVTSEMEKRGIRIITNTIFEKIEEIGAGRKAVHLTNGERLETDQVMWAVGRWPATQGLGLDKAGVETNEKGAVLVDDYSRTTVDTIYAVGDATDRVNLTPVAIREGAAFAETCFKNNPTRVDYADIPKAVFSQPPVGSVGLSESEARQKYDKIDIYKTEFRALKATLSGSTERISMKLVVDAASDRVLGCHIVGADAGEMIQIVAIAVKAGLTKKDFDATVALHPTSAEELVTMREKYEPDGA